MIVLDKVQYKSTTNKYITKNILFNKLFNRKKCFDN